MKFGKLADVSQVDFSLPAEPATNAAILREQGHDGSEPLQIYLGVTGWSMPEWKGKWYPAKAKTTQFLQFYGEQFNGIELNTTHYRVPDAATVLKWYAQTPDDFVFSPKVPQRISHHGELGLGSGDIPLFTDAISGLQEKLGCSFIQLPPYFGIDRLPVLERFLRAWPDQLPLAVEVRHESWFATPEAQEAYFRVLEAHRAIPVLSDVAARRDVLHMRLTQASTMIRFVGYGLVESDYRRADDWVQQLADWQQQGLRTAYLFAHEPDNVLTPDLAHYFLEQLQQHPLLTVRGPALYAEESPGEQMQLF